MSLCDSRPSAAMTADSGLPVPSSEALAQSEALLGVMQDEMSMAPDESISFRRYMEMALYHPGLGYYVAGSRKFGPDGDFITAPELGDVFARCLANQIAEIFHAVGGDTLLEFGAGSGRLAGDLLLALQALDALPQRYLILEPSPDLQHRQKAHLSSAVPSLMDRVEWLQGLPASPFRGCILANEVLDAMPVVRFRVGEEGIVEQTVRLSETGFQFDYRPLPPALETPVNDLLTACRNPLPIGYTSEMNPQLSGWFNALAGTLDAGAALLIDYGYPRDEFYSAERNEGTLSCFYRHRSHSDPFLYPGLQDITAHVDFSGAAEAADAAGLDILGFTSQMAFLVGNGLEAIANASDPDDTAHHLALSQQIKTLTMPGEMGELFKVLAVGLGIDGELQGFRFMDQRRRL